MEETYSFNELLKASFIELSNKLFIDTNNDEELGFIWAKYSPNSKINAIISGGIIEFIMDNNKINKIYGIDYDKNLKVFKAVKR